MKPAVLRLLDANANRAREGLRVMEDYARFVLVDQELCGQIKEIRHGLTGILCSRLVEAILHRNTSEDVGTSIKTESEIGRADVASVVTAAAKRTGEALRAIEEYLKTLDSTEAAAVEKLRYRVYELEQRLARTLRPAKLFADVRLYVLVTERCCRADWLATAEQAILGGADCLQLREKDLPSAELLARAKRLVALCRRYGKLCIINDRADIASLSDADGVHVGQEDLPVIEARKLVGPAKIVGVSTHTVEQARRGWLDGADYLGVGPMFRSPTKPREILPGPDLAREIARHVPLPLVAIAGITHANVDEVLATGVQAIAVTAAVLDCDDPKSAAQKLKNRLMPSRR